jgi:hypothetical protein
MTQYEREHIGRVIGMLTTLEYIISKPDGAGEAVTAANDILKEVLNSEDKTAS